MDSSRIMSWKSTVDSLIYSPSTYFHCLQLVTSTFRVVAIGDSLGHRTSSNVGLDSREGVCMQGNNHSQRPVCLSTIIRSSTAMTSGKKRQFAAFSKTIPSTLAFSRSKMDWH